MSTGTVTQNRNNRTKRLIWGLLLAAGGFFSVTFLAYVLGANTDTITKASDTLYRWRYLLMAVRVVVVFIVWSYWGRICEKIYPVTLEHYLEKREAFATQRHKFLMGFLIVEFLLVQNVLGYLLGMIV